MIMESIDPDAQFMTVEEFVTAVKGGCYVDDDGFGLYSTATHMSEEKVFPSDVQEGRINTKWGYVTWFNK